MSNQFNQPFLEKILKGSPGLIYIFNIDTQTVEYTSLDDQDISGYASTEILSMENDVLDRMVHPDDLPSLLKHLEMMKHAKSNDTAYIEYRILAKASTQEDISYIWLGAHHTPLDRNDINEVVKICGVGLNITELRKTMLDLDSKNMLLTNINSLNPAHILITDAQSNMITYSNKTLEETFGYSIVGDSTTIKLDHVLEKIMPSDDYNTVISLLQELINNNSSDFYQMEIQFHSISQETRWFRYMISPYRRHPDGTVKSIIHYAIDLSQSKETRYELESKHAELEQFIYVSSHDLKQPLSTIVSALEILKKELKTEDDQVVNKCLSMISTMTVVMKENINAKLR